jgi:hypothetical protein
MERLRSRGRAQEPWQNEAFLARLQDAYLQVAAVLRKRRVEIVELDAADLDVGAATERVEAIGRRLAVKALEPSAGR